MSKREGMMNKQQRGKNIKAMWRTISASKQGAARPVSFGQALLFGGGVLSLLYFFGLWFYLGAIYLFHWFWLALGIFLLALGKALPCWRKLPGWFRCLFKGAVIVGSALFLITEAVIISTMLDQPEPGADYLIVLGAKVNGTTPSLSLQYRIEAAFEYLLENPKTIAVASGGQGENEGISEAEAIANALLSMGVPEERILREDKSTSTSENLLFSKACIESMGASPEKSSIVVVSSDFHIFRAKAIARNCGYGNVEGKSARSVPWLQPNYCARECFAIWNDALRGNLKF